MTGWVAIAVGGAHGTPPPIRSDVSNRSNLGDRALNSTRLSLTNQVSPLFRDFILLHYKLTQRDDAPFWRRCRNVEVPDTPALFLGRGRYRKGDTDLFALNSWVAVMLGQNGWPKDYDPMVDALDENKTSDQIDRAASAIAHAAGALRTHFDYIRAIGADARGNA